MNQADNSYKISRLGLNIFYCSITIITTCCKSLYKLGLERKHKCLYSSSPTNQDLFSLKKNKCHLLKILLGTLRVRIKYYSQNDFNAFTDVVIFVQINYIITCFSVVYFDLSVYFNWMPVISAQVNYSWLSLSRPRLSRITAYLEVKIWSLLKNENLITGNKILWKRGEIAPLFHNIFNICLTSRVQLHIHLLNAVVRFIFSSSLQIWYVEVQISRSIFESPLEFEITRVDCIKYLNLKSVRLLIILVSA